MLSWGLAPPSRMALPPKCRVVAAMYNEVVPTSSLSVSETFTSSNPTSTPSQRELARGFVALAR